MIITPPFTEEQKKVIEATNNLAEKCDKINANINKWGRKNICDIDGIDEMTEPKLKPCPFCGSDKVELRSGFAFNGAVHCYNCTADVVFDACRLVADGNSNWQEACINGWNKRVRDNK